MKKIRMGLVGCGHMMQMHMRGIDQVRNAEFVAVFSGFGK